MQCPFSIKQFGVSNNPALYSEEKLYTRDQLIPSLEVYTIYSFSPSLYWYCCVIFSEYCKVWGLQSRKSLNYLSTVSTAVSSSWRVNISLSPYSISALPISPLGTQQIISKLMYNKIIYPQIFRILVSPHIVANRDYESMAKTIDT